MLFVGVICLDGDFSVFIVSNVVYGIAAFGDIDTDHVRNDDNVDVGNGFDSPGSSWCSLAFSELRSGVTSTSSDWVRLFLESHIRILVVPMPLPTIYT